MTEPHKPKHFNISLKRVYEAPNQNDGMRILVERLWPRGLSKEKAAIDHWLKDIAPSPDLRRWFNHRPERWAEFLARYEAELDANAEGMRELLAIIADGPSCLVFAARDKEHNSAVALKTYLDVRMGANVPT